MANLIDITNLTDAGLDTILKIRAGEDFDLPAGLSNLDLDAIKAEMVKLGNDPARVGTWLCAYIRQQNRNRN